MTMMTPGLAGSLTPHDWTPRQLERRERSSRAARRHTVRARLHLPRLHRGTAVS